MPSSTRDRTCPDEEIVVEAATTADALREVRDRLGPRARIIEASKVTRGGVAGFFARELVQLRASAQDGSATPGGTAADGTMEPGATGDEAPRPGATGDEAPRLGATGDGAPRPGDPGGDTALARLLGQLSSEVNRREETFGQTLRRHLGAEFLGEEFAGAASEGPSPAQPHHGDVDDSARLRTRPLPERRGAVRRGPLAGVHTSHTPNGSASAPASLPAGRAPTPEPPAAAWAPEPSAAAWAPEPPAAGAVLAEPPLLGGPPPARHRTAEPRWSADRLVRLGLPSALLAGWRDTDDDLRGLVLFAHLVAPWCAQLPVGPPLYVGPRAARLGRALGARTCAVGDEVPADGPLAVALRDGERGRRWLDAHRHGRRVHLVVGGSGWERLALERPEAVSWASAASLPDALRLATELSLPLGYGLSTNGVRPADPVDIAVAVREQLRAR